MCDRNVKSEYILIKLSALVFEYLWKNYQISWENIIW